jgi:hypothetical protein
MLLLKDCPAWTDWLKQFYVEILLGSTTTALSSLIRPCKSRHRCSRGNKGSRTDRRTDTYKWYS